MPLPPTDLPAGHRIELFVRTTVPGAHDRLEAAIARVERMVDVGALDSYQVRTWEPRTRVGPTSGPHHQSILNTVTEFERWADRTGLSIHPPFDRHAVDSSFTGETEDVIVLPVMCVAVYTDGDLIEVVPCADGRRTYTVGDCLDALEDGKIGCSPGCGRRSQLVS